MNSILEIFAKKDGLHHAYLVTGGLDANIPLLREAIEKLMGAPLSGCLDYFECLRSNFTVSDSEFFIAKQSTLPFNNGKRFFVLAGLYFTPEAQNKLLKVLEEPLQNNHIFVFVPKAEALLPTLLSRLFVVQGVEPLSGELRTFCENFVKSNLTDRMVMIEKFLKEHDGDDESAKVKHKLKEILGQLEKIFAMIVVDVSGARQKEVSVFLTDLLKIKKYLDDSAPASRLIFEYVAFICPQDL